MRRTVRWLALLLALTILVLSGCSAKKADSGSGGGKGGTLIIGIESEADVLDPHRFGGWVTHRISRQIHEPLVGEDLSKTSDQAPVPPLKGLLAETWDISPDGKTYTFHLRKNVKFHDGTPFNAAAVEFNVRRMWDKTFKWYDERSASTTVNVWQALQDVKVVDDNTVQFVLSRPFSPMLRMLGQGPPSTGIISPTALQKYGQDGYAEHPVGTGPFKFVERVRGQKIVVDRNDDYWGQKPILDRVIFRPLPEAAARVTALQTGEADVIAVPPPDSIDTLKNAGFDIVTGRPPHVWYLSFNLENKYFKDKRVRQAVMMAIDREGMAKNLLKGTANAAYSIQSPGNPAFDPSFRAYPHDPEKAKQLLSEAGYAGGFETIFQTSVDGSGQLIPVPMAEWIQRDLAKVGIKVKLDTYEWISYIGKWLQPMPADVGFNQMSWGFTTPYWIYMIDHSKGIVPNGVNTAKFSNANVDKLLDQAVSETDEQKALQVWKQAHQAVMDELPHAPIINDLAPFALSKRVHGFVSPAEEWYDLTQVSLGK